MIPSYFAGQLWDLEHLPKEAFDIYTIADSLSKINRYQGHTPYPYSVAQHSVVCSYLVPGDLAFDALMHDAAEAYIGDIHGPLKHRLPEFLALERLIETQLDNVFDIDFLNPAVKTADAHALDLEQVYIQGRKNFLIPDLAPPLVMTLLCEMSWREARSLFLYRYAELGWRT